MDQGVKDNKVIKFILGFAVLGMVGFMFWLWVFNYRTLSEVARLDDQVAQKQTENFKYYVKEYQVTKVALDETTAKLSEVTQELEAANSELTNARGELTEVQGVNDQLRAQISALEHYKSAASAKGEALESMINNFKKKNRALDHDLQSLRKELAVYQPDVSDMDQGRSKVQLFKNHIRLVKQNMSSLRRKAEELRVAAQKERDRLETLYGNGGYMVKDGQNKSVSSPDQKNVQIDVKFVN